MPIKKIEALKLERDADTPIEAGDDVITHVTKVNSYGTPNEFIGLFPRASTEALLKATGWKPEGELIDGDVVRAYWHRELAAPPAPMKGSKAKFIDTTLSDVRPGDMILDDFGNHAAQVTEWPYTTRPRHDLTVQTDVGAFYGACDKPVKVRRAK